MTLFIALITLVFITQQTIVLVKRQGTSFKQQSVLGYYENDFVFDHEQGLNIAFGLIDMRNALLADAKLNRPLEEFATLRAFKNVRAINREYDEEIEIHRCTEEELDNFYPFNKSQKSFEWVIYRLPVLYCVDPSDLVLKGDQYSQSRSSLQLVLEIPPSNCRADDLDLECIGTREFERELSFKNFLMLMNRKSFDKEDYYSETPIVEEKTLQWIPMPKIQTKVNMVLKMSEVKREDNLLMQINNLTEVEEPFFQIEQETVYNTGFTQFNRRLQVDLNLDAEVTLINREVYNLFMLLGDVGGLSGFLLASGSVIMSVINFQKAENFVVDKLFLASEASS